MVSSNLDPEDQLKRETLSICLLMYSILQRSIELEHHLRGVV
jgi:hypothetical protein